MSTQHDYRVTVAIDGKDIGVFDSRTGGEIEADVQRKNTGTGPKLYPARAVPGDVTVVRGYERERDHELSRHLATRCGKAQMVVSEQPLDEDGNAWGRPKVFTGLLRTVNTGDVDADSEDPRDLELTMTVKETQ